MGVLPTVGGDLVLGDNRNLAAGVDQAGDEGGGAPLKEKERKKKEKEKEKEKKKGLVGGGRNEFETHENPPATAETKRKNAGVK